MALGNLKPAKYQLNKDNSVDWQIHNFKNQLYGYRRNTVNKKMSILFRRN